MVNVKIPNHMKHAKGITIEKRDGCATVADILKMMEFFEALDIPPEKVNFYFDTDDGVVELDYTRSETPEEIEARIAVYVAAQTAILEEKARITAENERRHQEKLDAQREADRKEYERLKKIFENEGE